MESFFIDKSVFGTVKHIAVSETGSMSSCEIYPDTSWQICKDYSKSKNLDILLKLNNIEIPNIPDEFLKMYSFRSEQPPWRYIVPRDVLQKKINDTIDIVRKNWKSLAFDYHETWMIGQRFLDQLSPVSIDLLRYASIANASNYTGVITTFKPPCQKACYNRFSRTGRMTIETGPNILALDRQHREIITSEFPGGQIFYIDFVSLEPRIVALETQTKTDHDLYEKYNKYSLERDVIKQFVVSKIYGASASTLKTNLHSDENTFANLFVEISNDFGIKKLENKLKSQMKNGFIRNRFGRPVNSPEHLVINSYSQSTGVDVALLGFDKINKIITSFGGKSLFVLHDGLIVDVPADLCEKVRKITSVKIPSYSHSFPVKVKNIKDLS